MKILKLIAAILLGALMIAGGVGHHTNKAMIMAFIPDFLPWRVFLNYASGILEIVLGIGILIPAYRQQCAKYIVILLILLLPIHLVDVLREQPIIGSTQAAIIRIPFQLLFILMGWFVSRGEPRRNSDRNGGKKTETARPKV